jgi:ribonuclease HI
MAQAKTVNAPATSVAAATPSSPDQWLIHCDGSAMPNPGRMGLGALLQAPDGTEHALSHAPHSVGCNNEAELRALMLALSEAQAHGAQSLRIVSDSRLLIDQLGSSGAAPIARLALVVEAARTQLQHFAAIEWQWVPRHRNGAADALARAALGAPPKVTPKPHTPRKKRR